MVCVGNQCRSPLAERLLQHRLGPEGPLAAVVGSAGTFGPSGRPMEPNAAAELARLGGDANGFVSRRLTPSILTDQDLVLTATRDLRTEVLRLGPRMMRRTFTLAELAGIIEAEQLSDGQAKDLVATAAARRTRAPRDVDIPDPIGQSAGIHREVADRVASCVDVISGALRP